MTQQHSTKSTNLKKI